MRAPRYCSIPPDRRIGLRSSGHAEGQTDSEAPVSTNPHARFAPRSGKAVPGGLAQRLIAKYHPEYLPDPVHPSPSPTAARIFVAADALQTTLDHEVERGQTFFTIHDNGSTLRLQSMHPTAPLLRRGLVLTAELIEAATGRAYRVQDISGRISYELPDGSDPVFVPDGILVPALTRLSVRGKTFTLPAPPEPYNTQLRNFLHNPKIQHITLGNSDLADILIPLGGESRVAMTLSWNEGRYVLSFSDSEMSHKAVLVRRKNQRNFEPSPANVRDIILHPGDQIRFAPDGETLQLQAIPSVAPEAAIPGSPPRLVMPPPSFDYK